MINQIGPGLDFAVYNVGNNRPGKIVEMDEMYLPKTPRIAGYNYWGYAKPE